MSSWGLQPSTLLCLHLSLVPSPQAPGVQPTASQQPGQRPCPQGRGFRWPRNWGHPGSPMPGSGVTALLVEHSPAPYVPALVAEAPHLLPTARLPHGHHADEGPHTGLAVAHQGQLLFSTHMGPGQKTGQSAPPLGAGWHQLLPHTCPGVQTPMQVPTEHPPQAQGLGAERGAVAWSLPHGATCCPRHCSAPPGLCTG